MAIGPPGFTTRNSSQRVADALRRDVHEGAHRPQRIEHGVHEWQVVKGRIDGEQPLRRHRPAILRTEVDTDDVEPVVVPEQRVETRPGADIDQRSTGFDT